MLAAARKAPLASSLTDRLYYPCSSGHIFATSHVTRRPMQLPFYGIIALSRDGKPLNLHTGDRLVTGDALAICTRTVRFFDCHSDLVLIVVNPLHENFRAFSRLNSRHAIALDRKTFAAFEQSVDAALAGTLTHEAAVELFDGAQAAVRPYLPTVPQLDERARILVQALWSNPRCSVTELAQRLRLSYHRTSHYFTESVGIPMRTYQLWQKLFKAGEPLLAGASLTDAALAAGFVDSAHFSSAFQKAFGRAPSELFRSSRVSIYATNPFCKGRGETEPGAG